MLLDDELFEFEGAVEVDGEAADASTTADEATAIDTSPVASDWRLGYSTPLLPDVDVLETAIATEEEATVVEVEGQSKKNTQSMEIMIL